MAHGPGIPNRKLNCNHQVQNLTYLLLYFMYFGLGAPAHCSDRACPRLAEPDGIQYCTVLYSSFALLHSQHSLHDSTVRTFYRTVRALFGIEQYSTDLVLGPPDVAQGSDPGRRSLLVEDALPLRHPEVRNILSRDCGPAVRARGGQHEHQEAPAACSWGEKRSTWAEEGHVGKRGTWTRTQLEADMPPLCYPPSPDMRLTKSARHGRV